MERYHHIAVAIPMMAESGNVPRLLQLLREQHDCNFTLYVCVNQPEGWHEDASHRDIFEDNQQTLSLLQAVNDIPLTVIDRSSIGHGWQGKQKGVGWARKLLFEKIIADTDANELIVSLDADTDFQSTYLRTVRATMNRYADCNALCVPYYHPTSGDEALDRSLLRYECYMRHYFMQLLRISSPYAFSALGSAMVFPAWAYRKAGGMSPLQGGEDFYLMQRFCKTGKIVLGTGYNLTVKPQGRISTRVPFGTGPAVAQGMTLQAERYPFYPQQGFDEVGITMEMFKKLYQHDVETPMSSFLKAQLRTDELWQPLRKNFKTQELFEHACHERVDGLRILQYLKQCPTRGNEIEFADFCRQMEIALVEGFSFFFSPIDDITTVRDALFHKEMELRLRAPTTTRR